MDSYQSLSSPKPTLISLDNSSALVGTVSFAFLDDVDNDLFMAETLDLLSPACILVATSVPGCSNDGSVFWSCLCS